jgi:AmiR/NasT family two-component response regulator
MARVPFSPALQGVRILIVEDESILAMDLENRLKGAGCEVIGLVSREAKAPSSLNGTDLMRLCWLSI